MLDEIILRVSEKTGLSQDQARSAVNAALEFLKERLPAPFASGLESMIAGESAQPAGEGSGGGESLATEATELLGNLFGKK